MFETSVTVEKSSFHSSSGSKRVIASLENFSLETFFYPLPRKFLPRKFLLSAGISNEAGFEDDSMPECFEAFNQAMGSSNGVAFVEVVRAKILVGGGPVEHVVSGG